MTGPLINIGLLWDEPEIRGELICFYSAKCFTDCNRWIELPEIAGHFHARVIPETPDKREYGIRLGECFSKEYAQRILAPVYQAKPEWTLDIVSAGRKWNYANQEFDNTVYWPVVQLQNRADGQRILQELRKLDGVNPIGLFEVRLDTATAKTHFEITVGEFSAKCVDIVFTPLDENARIWLYDVPIGRGFHWERKERLEYRGSLRLFQPSVGLSAVNGLPLESYLESAVGSEMRSDLPHEFSKAQAISARSTVLATAFRHHRADGFDVCNDDHCQCYQGTIREANAVIAPVRETAGQVLIYPPRTSPRSGGEQRIVDARYAKSCGGISERYEAVWGEVGPEYFAIRACGNFQIPDLSNDQTAREFLNANPKAWCNPEIYPYPKPWNEDKLFRWERDFTPENLRDLLKEKIGNDVGFVKRLDVIKRGESGRILILDVAGTLDTVRIHGELEIRRALSQSHLPSSYFVVDYANDQIKLTGGGWGHGVGLCQLGASAMAKAGWSAIKILDHYYPNTELTK